MLSSLELDPSLSAVVLSEPDASVSAVVDPVVVSPAVVVVVDNEVDEPEVSSEVATQAKHATNARGDTLIMRRCQRSAARERTTSV